MAAIDCDVESNKPFCSSMGVRGFPTLKIVQPGKKKGKPSVEDYQGARNAKAIVEAVLDKIPNHVRRLADKDIKSWLKDSNDTAKAILFTNKGAVSPQLKSLAVDFLGGISVAQVRDREKAAVEMFGVKTFPTFVLLPGGDQEALVHDGPMKKQAMAEFLKQIRSPNPDPAPKAAKAAKAAKTSSKGEKKGAKKEKAKMDDDARQFVLTDEEEKKEEKKKEKPEQDQDAASHTSGEGTTESIRTVTVDVGAIPTDAFVELDSAAPAPLETLETAESLSKACFGPKASTCILALRPAAPNSGSGSGSSSNSGSRDGDGGGGVASSSRAQLVIDSEANLARIVHSYEQRKAAIFPFYAVPASNTRGAEARSAFGLSKKDDGDGGGGDDGVLEVIALNARRGWWRRFDGDASNLASLEAWVDAVKLGEGHRQKLPDGIVNTVHHGDKSRQEGKEEKEEKEEEKGKHDEL